MMNSWVFIERSEKRQSSEGMRNAKTSVFCSGGWGFESQEGDCDTYQKVDAQDAECHACLLKLRSIDFRESLGEAGLLKGAETS